jgi:predicted nucleic acid-binding protein
VLIEVLNGTPKGAKLLAAVRSGAARPHMSLVNIAEAAYILCRKVGHAAARTRIDALLASGYVAVEDDLSIHLAAAEIKCERSISLADCYTMAVARTIGSGALFASPEKELVDETRRKPFDQPVHFLE